MSKSNKKLVPELRFPEFRSSDAWEEKPLGNYIEELREKSTVQDEREVLTSSRNGLIRQRDYYDNNERIADRDNIGFNIIPPNYLTYRSRSDDRRFFFNENNLGITGIISSYYPVFRLVNSTNKFFVELLSVHSNTIGKRSVGTSQTVLSLNELKRIQLPFPKIAEQQKIADCLSSIDDLITAQSQKVEALKTHKKGLMQQLFPREGETVPRLRFPEFRDAGEWVEKTLKDVCKMQAGKFVRAADIFDEPNRDLYPCYGGNGQRGFTKSFTHEGKYSLIGRQGALCGNITLANGKFHATEHAVVVSPNIDVNTDWLFYMLGYMNLNQHATGQAQPGLSVENLEKLPIAISTEEKEQQKIASCLSSIDELITVQAQKLESLKTHKKGLMQQIFPTASEIEG